LIASDTLSGENTRLTKIPEDVEILNSLGLSINGARVLLALSQLGASTARTISKSSGVAREVVYQIMPRLMKKGLVEEIITAPKKFKAIPLKEAYAILLRRKEEENRKLAAKAIEALKRHQNKTDLKVEEDQQIILFPSSGGQHFRINQEFERVKESIDLTFLSGKFLQWSQHYAEWGITQAKKKNVKIRIITEQQLLKILVSHPEIFSPSFISDLEYLNLKYVKNPLSVELMIFDKKTLFISITKEININKMCWLRTNNPFIAEIANSYFERLWSTAKARLRGSLFYRKKKHKKMSRLTPQV
jgi:sugar-specific transcriptional regulator TrmB